MSIVEGFGPTAASLGGGFFIGVLIGYALKKVIKLLSVIVGLFFAGLAYLQYRAPDDKEDQEDRTRTTIVHRVVEINQTDDKSNNNKSSSSRIIRTKGDANPSSIPGFDYPVREQDYIGKVVYVIPGVGLITKVFRPPVSYIIISVTLTILLFLYIKKGKRGQEKRKNNK